MDERQSSGLKDDAPEDTTDRDQREEGSPDEAGAEEPEE